MCKRRTLVLIVSFVLSLLTAPAARAQTAPPAQRRPMVSRDRVDPHWFSDNTRFWYRNDLADGNREFVLVDTAKGKREPAFDHSKVAEALSKAVGNAVTAEKLPIDSLEFAANLQSVRLRGREKTWKLDLSNYQVTADGAGGEPAARPADNRPARPRRDDERQSAAKSPDGKWEAFVRDHNLWLRDRESKGEIQLTTDATAKETYGRDKYREQAVEMNRQSNGAFESLPQVYWSPDSKRLAAMRTHTAPNHTVYLVESSPKDQVQPKLLLYAYLKPGDDLPTAKPHLFDATTRKEIAVSDALFQNPWEIDRMRWEADSSRFTFLYNQRGHQVLRVVAVDASTGQATALVDEKSGTFIDYSGKLYYEQDAETGETIWASERDGWNHLYLYDAKTGRLKNQITSGQWLVRGVDRVDREKRQIWFRAGGIRARQDPYFIHFCRVNFDGTGLTILTEGNGTHEVQFSPDRRYLIDTWSRVDMPQICELRRAEDGSLACELEHADAGEVLLASLPRAEPFVAKGRDGTTDIYGVIIRPANFDSTKKYPIVESIYAGPQSSYVPKSFRSSYGPQRIANLGFIVVQIDGMGTSNRSKSFHDVCWKNLADAGFPDRIPWIKAAAAKYPQMDLSRVGVYGGSAGGQNALGALLWHGDFYKVAVADCGCHDNRMDKIWWNEQWMGWPVGKEYAECSNVVNAQKLTGKLMLIVGELDHNVDPASTMQVVNALEKAGKDFELVIVTGSDHGAGESPFGSRKRAQFLQRNLLEGSSN